MRSRMRLGLAPLSRQGRKAFTAGAPRRFQSNDASDYNPTSTFLERMHARGFIHQCTNMQALDKLLQEESVTAYIGFDATAPSLHVGSLLQIMILRNLQKTGHKPIILMGGATTKVGDPSGKDASRKMMDDKQIQENIESISRVFSKFLTIGDGPTDAVIVDNSSWLDDFGYLQFLREFGPHFSVNRMLNFESVKQRLDREQPLSFLEFNYMLLQAVDFLELYRRHNVKLQVGGSDQWGNIVNGVELGRRIEQINLFGLTAPLVVTSDGRKMGKSESGAVWLDAELLSEYEYWQFWRNTADADTIRFLKLFTEIPEAELAELEKLQGAELNDAKILLADAATRMLHGQQQLQAVRETVENVFSGQTSASADALPHAAIIEAQVAEGTPVVDLFVALEFCKSKKEVKRLIKGGGARLNGEQIKDERLMVHFEQFQDGELRLSAGKKRHGVIFLRK